MELAERWCMGSVLTPNNNNNTYKARSRDMVRDQRNVLLRPRFW